MEDAEGDRASSGDELELDEEADGLENAYSVSDLLGELNSDIDNDAEATRDEQDPDCTLQQPDDSTGSDLYVSANVNCAVTSETPVKLKGNATPVKESAECSAVPDSGSSVPVTYDRIYDEVLIENIYQDPAEKDDCTMTSK